MSAEAPAWTVHTDVFEGPLDLLLYLVKRDGIDLATLEVAVIADAYLAYVEQMRRVNLSVAGDYLVMAATLIHLKSLDLLPRLPTPEDEEEPDPREVFAEQLRRYERYKAAAAALDRRPVLGRDQFARPDEELPPGELERPFDIFGLLELYRGLLQQAERPEPQVVFEERPPLTVGEAVRGVLERLHEAGGRGDLGAILREFGSRAARVITFVGVLEMLKLGWVEAHQAYHLGPVELVASIGPREADLRAIEGYVEVAQRPAR